ncbi:MAG: hypothetical protein MRY64_00565 [Hyphomonadaceae bacterium]|nr:hypothetical protein [Hyphomonadaceae bacterium]
MTKSLSFRFWIAAASLLWFAMPAFADLQGETPNSHSDLHVMQVGEKTQAQYEDPFLTPANLQPLEQILSEGQQSELRCLAGHWSKLEINYSYSLSDPSLIIAGKSAQEIAAELSEFENRMSEEYPCEPPFSEHQYLSIVRLQNLNRYIDLANAGASMEELDILYQGLTTACEVPE